MRPFCIANLSPPMGRCLLTGSESLSGGGLGLISEREVVLSNTDSTRQFSHHTLSGHTGPISVEEWPKTVVLRSNATSIGKLAPGTRSSISTHADSLETRETTQGNNPGKQPGHDVRDIMSFDLFHFGHFSFGRQAHSKTARASKVLTFNGVDSHLAGIDVACDAFVEAKVRGLGQRCLWIVSGSEMG